MLSVLQKREVFIMARSIGTLADVGASATYRNEESDANAKIEHLERRVSTLELLVNDLMHHLDSPTRAPASSKKGTKRKTQQKASGAEKKGSVGTKQKTQQKASGAQNEYSAEALNSLTEYIREHPGHTRTEIANVLDLESKVAGRQLH